MIDLALCYKCGVCGLAQNMDRCVELMLQAANCGRLEAIHYMGTMFALGCEGVVRSDERAAEMWKLGMSLGDVRSTHELATCFADGRGVHQDVPQALELYQKALELDPYCVQALTHLGEMYFAGRGVPKDRRHAVRLLREAHDHGHHFAQATLEVILGGS